MGLGSRPISNSMAAANWQLRLTLAKMHLFRYGSEHLERLLNGRRARLTCVFLNAFETGSEARAGIGRWIGYYNADRPHSAFGGRTPNETYAIQATTEKLAA